MVFEREEYYSEYNYFCLGEQCNVPNFVHFLNHFPQHFHQEQNYFHLSQIQEYRVGGEIFLFHYDW